MSTEEELNEISMLEKHIMQAEAKAIGADERYTNRRVEGVETDLGIPNSSNHFRSAISLPDSPKQLVRVKTWL